MKMPHLEKRTNETLETSAADEQPARKKEKLTTPEQDLVNSVAAAVANATSSSSATSSTGSTAALAVTSPSAAANANALGFLHSSLTSSTSSSDDLGLNEPSNGSTTSASGAATATTVANQDDKSKKLANASAAAAAAAAAANPNLNATLSALQQQQLQLLQVQQQLPAGDLAAFTQQMAAWGFMMMPIMPLMMQNLPANGNGVSTGAATGGNTAQQQQHQDQQMLNEAAAAVAAAAINAVAVASGGNDANVLGQSENLLGDTLGVGSGSPQFSGNDDTPKRKRGRPSKNVPALPVLPTLPGVVAPKAAKEGDQALKQQPALPLSLWMPWGAAGLTPEQLQALTSAGALGLEDPVAAAGTSGGARDDEGVSVGGLQHPQRSTKASSKKKNRGTGRPRGRPRTRPRPGEVIHRAKPAAIAPANYSVMYSMANSTLKQATDSNGAGAAAQTQAADSRIHEDTRHIIPEEEYQA